MEPLALAWVISGSIMGWMPSSVAAESSAAAKTTRLEAIRVSKATFVFASSGARFTPSGFNYDHDRTNRLLEYYWKDEWQTVVADFGEMKALGANTVRIHLQVSRFMKSAQEVNSESFELLAKLVALAETNRLYLDVTGLGCYDKPDVPQWYSDLAEAARWEVQARFWQAVARVCRQSPAIFCYDLMNEPILTDDKKDHDWTPGKFADRYFVQRLTLDLAGRSGAEVANAWLDKLISAIRQEDAQHLITVGAIPWTLKWPGAKPDFYSNQIGMNLDFVSVHFYPRSGELKQALNALSAYKIGKPILIKEMFPLNCSMQELDQFIEKSKGRANGWLGFYWGETIGEYRATKSPTLTDAKALEWLEYFKKRHRN